MEMHNLFIKANFEILTTDLDTRPKISVLTLQSLRGPGCSVISDLKIEYVQAAIEEISVF